MTIQIELCTFAFCSVEIPFPSCIVLIEAKLTEIELENGVIQQIKGAICLLVNYYLLTIETHRYTSIIMTTSLDNSNQSSIKRALCRCSLQKLD